MSLSTEHQRKVQLLSDRFAHRKDVFATQWYNQNKGIGGWTPELEEECTHGCKTSICPHKVYAPITTNAIIKHLQGNHAIGVYQLGDKDTVKWLCFDIDFNKGTEPNWSDLEAVTRGIQKELSRVGVKALVEDSTNKGVHLWVLLESPLPAHVLLTFGHWILDAVEMPDYMHVEVFPKQTTKGNKFGSLVRLPLGFHQKTNKRTEFLNPATLERMDLNDQWKLLATYPLLTRDRLREIFGEQGIKSAPPPSSPALKPPRSSTSKVQKCLAHLMNEGAGEGLRDAATFRLACLLRDYEVPIDLASAMLNEWNDTKNDPPLEPQEIQVPLESAYSNNYSAYPCSDRQFDSICSSDCYWYENKMKMRQSRKR